MGLYDTVHLGEKALRCPRCGKEIRKVQVRFGQNTLEHYALGDCILHVEDYGVRREGLWCDDCQDVTGAAFLAVYRGILTAVVDSFDQAKRDFDEMNLEKMVIWYHSLFKRMERERRGKAGVLRFLRDLVMWHEDPGAQANPLAATLSRTYLEGVADPIESIKRYLDSPEAAEEPQEADSWFL